MNIEIDHEEWTNQDNEPRPSTSGFQSNLATSSRNKDLCESSDFSCENGSISSESLHFSNERDTVLQDEQGNFQKYNLSSFSSLFNFTGFLVQEGRGKLNNDDENDNSLPDDDSFSDKAGHSGNLSSIRNHVSSDDDSSDFSNESSRLSSSLAHFSTERDGVLEREQGE